MNEEKKTPKTTEDLEKRFSRDGSLTRKKLFEYIPAMVITNLSTLLLISVDGLVLGNFVGSDALSAVNIFYPATMFIGLVSLLLGVGASSAISTCMGRNDAEGLRRLKKTVTYLLVIFGLIISVLQVPIVYGLISSYHLNPEINAMTWQYSIGIMIATPMGLISTVGVYQLQILGKMKVLMWLTLTEGLANLAFDLLFVAVFDMGPMGASLGTACASLIRSSMTLIYLLKKTDIFKFGKIKIRKSDVKDIISSGLPEASNSMILAAQNYFIMIILVAVFGSDGGVIKGVCVFCFNLVNVITTGVQGAMRPLLGLLSGADDRDGIRTLMKQGITIMLCIVAVMTLVIELIPGVFYDMHGVKVIPDGGILSVRLYALFFLFKAVDTIFRLYFTNRKDSGFSTGLTILGNCTLPLFAWGLSVIMAAPFVWLSYLFTEGLIFIISLIRYFGWLKKDKREESPDNFRLYLTVDPKDAIEASRLIRRYADEKGTSKKIMNRISLCMEEMVFYAVKSQKNDKIRVQVEIFFSGDSARFMMLDDGACISLNEDSELREISADNYELLKRVAKSVQYQYILDMNYSILTF
ncbi:MAG: polysaccharide biosynthesis C-terminal domain-containing protein [Eubacterium sp.]|nr:polysaccharide biosynthesis C-terminal domain-containing protein [Eubacterium sp.]